MCNPAAAQFGFQAVQQVGGFMAQQQAVNARNRARLLNFNEENKKYYRDTILNNVRWKNGLLDAEIAYDNLFQKAYESWRVQDLEIEKAKNEHTNNTIDALTELYRKEYAGTQTGVTASRLANEGTRQVGRALTKSSRQLMMAKDGASLQKEIVTMDANRRRRSIFQDTWRSPIHGHTPTAPVLEGGPSVALLAAGLGVSALNTIGKDWFKGSKPDFAPKNYVPSGEYIDTTGIGFTEFNPVATDFSNKLNIPFYDTSQYRPSNINWNWNR